MQLADVVRKRPEKCIFSPSPLIASMVIFPQLGGLTDGVSSLETGPVVDRG